MEFRRLWGALRARWTVVVALGLVGLILGGVFLLVTPRTYSADARLYLGVSGADTSSDLAQGSTYSEQQANSYGRVATTTLVLRPVIRALDLGVTPAQLARRVDVQVANDSSIIDVSVADTDGRRAAATANAIGSSLVNAVGRLSPVRSDGTTPVRLTVVEPAVAPSAPSGPSTAVALILGVLGGLILGLIVVVVAEAVARPVRTVEDVAQETDAPILGTVVADRLALRHPVVDGRGFRGEQYRQLRTVVSGMSDGGRIVITSALPGEGKSVVAVNLARALARTGRTVCLVDANLRSPALARLAGVSDVTGLTSVATDDVDVMSALGVPDGIEGLSVLPAGPSVDSPGDLLSSERVRDALTQLDGAFDFVIIDTPSLLAVTDALVLSDLSGGAVLVAESGRVRASQLADVAARIESTTTEVRGVVLNRVPASTFSTALRRAYRS